MEVDFMGKIQDLAWQAFEKTGRIKEYLKYKAHGENNFSLEVGEEIGAFEDHRNSYKDNKIQ
ncbi:MAG: hypothetical protein J6D15_04570 [Clostridia bacterium]|nr:hypothetical protein [Clostridia bacterium]